MKFQLKLLAAVFGGFLISSLASAPALAKSPTYAFYTPPSTSVTSPTAPNVSVSDATTSRNWSGYVADSGQFTEVSGSWTIPSISNSSGPSADAAWVGIGGVSGSDLIQVGTQAISSQGGSMQYQAWYEMLPGNSVTVPLTVKPGDSISASLDQTSAGQWAISISDNTTGQSYDTGVSYNSSLSSAEWVEEMPSSNFGFVPLDNFGSINFSNASDVQNGATVNLAQSGAQPMTMVNGQNQTLASPSAIGSDSASFTVTRSSAVASSQSVGSGSGFTGRGHWRRGVGISGYAPQPMPTPNSGSSWNYQTSYGQGQQTVTIRIPFGFGFMRMGR